MKTKHPNYDCNYSMALLFALRGAAMGVIIYALFGCVTVSHTLKDGTKIYASPDGIGGTTADGKTSVDLVLPKK